MKFVCSSFICLARMAVLSVASIELASNLLNSCVVWRSRSERSTTNNTFLIDGCLANNCPHLKEVSVFPEPVVCQI